MVVLPLGVLHARARDPEDRHAPAVRAAHQHRSQLAAAHQAECPEEEVVRLQHWRLPWTKGGEVGKLVSIEVGPALL